MQWLYLSVFVIDTIVHLYASQKCNQHLRDVTKGFILFSLLGFYLESVANPSWIIVLAIFFSFLGDMFLIPKGTKWFIIGGIAFMVSHVFFALGYAKQIDFTTLPIWEIIVVGLVYVTAVVVIFSQLKDSLKPALFYPMMLYLLINGTMNTFAWLRFLANPASIGTIITLLGAILFFISDTALFFKRFKKDGRQHSHFLVMLTYSLGELLIVLGIVLLA